MIELKYHDVFFSAINARMSLKILYDFSPVLVFLILPFCQELVSAEADILLITLVVIPSHAFLALRMPAL